MSTETITLGNLLNGLTGAIDAAGMEGAAPSSINAAPSQISFTQRIELSERKNEFNGIQQ